MTFSLVARCATTGMFGTAVASSSPAVAARCAHAMAGVGAVASQNITDPDLGTRALQLMASGASATEAIAILKRTPFAEYRQILAVDRLGTAAIHSGEHALGISAEASDANVASGGNLLANASIPQMIVNAFLGSSGTLADRLLAAMQAGLAGGGEAGPIHSAGIKVVDQLDWPIVDLRCDWSEGDPLAEVAAAWSIYKPQIDAYVTRARDPRLAPSYGVPGDL